MYLTSDVLFLNIFETEEQVETYEDLTQVREDWRKSLDGLYAWLNDFIVGKYMPSAESFASDDAENLLKQATKNVEDLIEKFETIFADSGIMPDGQVGSEALRSITTLEQVNALINGVVPQRLWICGYFPFSYFCD